MTDSNLPGSVPSAGTTSPRSGLQHRLRRNEQGRWVETPSQFGEWLTHQHGPENNGNGRTVAPGEPVEPPQPRTTAEVFGWIESPSSRRIHDTTFPLRRTEGEAGAGPSAPIPIGRGLDPLRQQPDPDHDGAWSVSRYEPIEESWSREWVERAGGDPSFETRGSSTGDPVSDYNHGDEHDGLEAFGADGRSFDDEELESGAAARRNAIEWAVVLVAATLLALVLRAVLVQAFYIPSPSMEDTLLIRDRVLVNKLSYRLHEINRGDIVVFHRTAVELEFAGPDEPKDVIKRVIALSGETIEIRNNQVLINGQVLLEPYLNESTAMPDFGPEVVPEDHIFVMGDNRNLSSDSRGELGPIDSDRVVGRAFFLFWPLDRLSLL